MITTVSSVTALNAALGAAQAGDTIKLEAGTYTGFSASNLSFTQDVTITSADSFHQAVLTNFSLTNVTGLSFSSVDMFATGGPNAFAFGVRNSTDVHFDGVNVHGSLDDITTDDPNGVSFLNSSDISVTNSTFQQLGRAISVGLGSNIQVTGNTVHDMRSDGFDLAQVDHVTITGNNLSNFHKNATDHPDAIQFWTSGTTAPSHDILVSGNVIAIGNGAGTQGIFFRDQLGNMPYSNVTISDNLIDGTGYNGIRIGHVNGLTLTDNQLTTNPGNNVETFFHVSDSDRVVSTNNSAVSIGFPNDTNLVETGDKIVGVSSDFGNANLATWLHAHGMDALYDSLANSTGATAAGPPPTAETLDATTLNLTLTGSGDVDGIGNALGNIMTGNLGDNHLYGMAGNDTLDGGTGGADILSGGPGNDRYYIQNGDDVVLEDAGEGTDTVVAKGNFILPSNVENLIINATVTNGWSGTGNSLNNVLTGNAGANKLEGGAGNDTLIGGGGDDRLTGGSGSDKFVFGPGAGHDVVLDFGANGERDILDLSALYAKGFHAALSETSAGVTLSFANGDTIMLQGQHVSTLHATQTGFGS